MSSKKGMYKCVKRMTDEEIKNSPGVNSVLDLFGSNDNRGWAYSKDFKFSYMDSDGELREQVFRNVCTTDDFIKDSFNEGTAIQPVRILKHDGEWETGFRWWEEKAVVVRRNGRLRPYYSLDGVYNSKTKKIEDMHEIDSSCRLPAWILKCLPLYNEKVRDGLEKMDSKLLPPSMSLQDCNALRKGINSNYFQSFGMKMKSLKLKGVGERTVPTKTWLRTKDSRPGSKCPSWHPITVTWEGDVCIQEEGIMETKKYSRRIPEKMRYFVPTYEENYDGLMNFLVNCEEDIEEDTLCYTYFKSIYEDVQIRKRIYHIIPMYNLLTISKSPYDKEGSEVWNNLDQTVIGNI